MSTSARAPQPSSGADPERQALRVVLIDDTPDVRDLLSLIIDRAPDFSVVADAADGHSGIAVAVRERPDVVLLDLAMPVMDGLEALPHLRSALPAAAIVVLSGFRAGALSQQAYDAGADGYLEKGTPAGQLLDRLRETVAPRFPGLSAAPPPEAPSASGNGAGPNAPAGGAAPPTAPTPASGANAGAGEDADEVGRLRRAIATITHEFSNPVTVLHGVLEELQQDHVPPERHQHLVEALSRQVRQLDQMCTDLLTAGRAGSGRLDVDVAVFDLMDLLRDLAAERGELTLLEAGTPHLLVRADQGRVEQMLTNLVSNAVRYGEPPVEVQAWLAATGRVHVAVSDRGPGVPPGFRPRLFDEFARADTAHRIAGNGLGLYVVRHLAEAHGGRVVYQDRPGGGAVFTFDLEPAGPAHEAR